jgi:hypothetical protein
MATDHAASLNADAHPDADAEAEAYVSPAADFLLLSILTAAVALAAAAVIIP